jgi:multisubunit Na+/H+ antiporter MnhB subunit
VKKFIIISIIVILGLIIFTAGMITGDIRFVATGFATIALPIFYLFIKSLEIKQKSAFELNENKDIALLPITRAILRKRGVKVSFLFAIIGALIIVIISWNFLSNSLFSTTPISVESIINKACAKMDPKTGCKNDPTTIIVPYDANNDGVQGGVNDTLTNLLKKYDCEGDCIKKRCSCPGY